MNDGSSKFLKQTFNLHAISDLLGIPRTSIYDNLTKIGVKPIKKLVGATKRNVYDWNAFSKIASEYRDQYILDIIPSRKIKAFVNQKGGVGKTSISHQFAMRCVTKGLRVLIVDDDPQGHSTLAFGINNNSGSGPTLKDVYEGKMGIRDLIIEFSPLLHLIPSNTDLANVELLLRTDFSGTKKLKKVIAEVYDDYDLIVIDTNPSFSWITVNAIIAAEELCFVCETALYSVDGVKSLFEVLAKLEDADPSFNPSLRIVPNRFKERENSSLNAMNFLRRNYPDLVTETTVRDCADLKNATDNREAVFLKYRRSAASDDIRRLTDELLMNPLN